MDGLALHNGFCVTAIVTCLFGCVGNMHTIWLLLSRLEKNPFSTYIGNVALADLGTVGFLAAALVAHSLHRSFFVFLYAFFLAMCMASLCFLIALSVDRCFSTLSPRWYRSRQPKCLSTRLSFVIWTLAGMFCGMEVSFYLVYGVSLNLTVGIMYIVDFWVLPSVLAICAAVLFIRLGRRYREHPPRSLDIVVVLVLLFFITVGGPSLVISSLSCFRGPLADVEFALFFFSVYGGIKPTIYCFVGKQRKCHSAEPLICALQRVFQGEGSATEGTELMWVTVSAKEACNAQAA